MKYFSFKRLAIIGLSGVLALSTASAFAETIKLTFASAFPVQQVITGKIIKPWIEEIEKKSNGKVKIKLFPAGALGKAPESFDVAEKGIADFSYHLADYTPGRFPLTSVFSLPFMVPSGQKVSEAMWEVFQKEAKFQEEYSKVKVLALFGHSGGHFHTVKVPIRKLADFEGQKIRTANPAISKALTLWGAVPVAQPITETYQALQLGVLDGSVLPYEGLVVFKLNEVVKYSTIAELYTMPMMIIMNKDSWNKLPKDVQDLIDSTTGMKMSSDAGKAFDNAEKPFREICMKKGIEEITLPAEEMAKMKEITMPLRKEWVEEMEGKGLPGKQVLESALKAIGQ